MSFYGKIVNYVTNVFNKINNVGLTNGKKGELIIQAVEDDKLKVETTSTINESLQSITIELSHNPSNITKSLFSTESNSQKKVQLVSNYTFDAAGHAIPTPENEEISLLTFIDDENGNISITIL